MEVRPHRRLIAIVIPPHAQSLDVSGPMDAFFEARRQSGGSAAYEFRLIAMSEDKIVQAGAMSLRADASIFDADETFDTLLVSGTADYEAVPETAMLQGWLRRNTAQARRYGAIGTGAFFLGAAGLLDGKNATTHWQHTAALAAAYPAARVLADHIYVEDGRLYTSAGVTAGIDLALKLIEDDHGRELARKIARRLVVCLKGTGRHAQFSAHLALQSADEERIQAVQRWILDHPSLDLTLQALAGRAAMGVRHFTRVFRRETGMTPGDFVDMTRVDAAKRLLEDCGRPLDYVASRCGFANAEVMRRVFLRRTGTRPSHYRERLRGPYQPETRPPV